MWLWWSRTSFARNGEEIATTTPGLESTPVPGAPAYEVELASDALQAMWILPSTATSIVLPGCGEQFGLRPGDDVRMVSLRDTDQG